MELDLGIETLFIIKDGQVCDIAKQDSFLHAFFTKQIVEEGLKDFHLTLASGGTEQEKFDLLFEVCDTWDDKGEKITNL